MPCQKLHIFTYSRQIFPVTGPPSNTSSPPLPPQTEGASTALVRHAAVVTELGYVNFRTEMFSHSIEKFTSEF